ncbi:hypothetical protein [Erythrobacter rubeus]|uniref:Uncharacterized protein n=1 Tax=Erythrobacter rubeus TaxID=2760803 RepID=A0ABR8KXC7_9SPHN|nr:hypothetical protein [Erythrobacter rubeus]MBD2842821.1 hypothetical protein [Erythrobacter rubeus]
MKSLAVISAVLGAIILGSSVFVETHLVPLVGAVLLSGGLVYSALQNAKAGSADLLEADKMGRQRKKT